MDSIIDMPDSGYVLTGKWYNKRNNKTVTVRDSIIDGDMMYVITDYGQITMDEFSRDYIQMSNELYDEHGKQIGDSSYEDDFKPQPIEFNLDFPTDLLKNLNNQAITQNPTTDLKKSTIVHDKTSSPASVIKPATSENNILLKKLFDKIEEKPNVTVNIDYANFPIYQLKTLRDFFDVSVEEIVDWIYINLLDPNQLKESIRDYVNSKLF